MLRGADGHLVKVWIMPTERAKALLAMIEHSAPWHWEPVDGEQQGVIEACNKSMIAVVPGHSHVYAQFIAAAPGLIRELLTEIERLTPCPSCHGEGGHFHPHFGFEPCMACSSKRKP